MAESTKVSGTRRASARKPAKQLAPLKGFISYAHADQALFDAFRVHLAAIERHLNVTFWADTSIHAGGHWNADIAGRIDEAHIFVLLMSPAWLSSRFIKSDEEPAIRARYRSLKTRGLICPVILSRCAWKPVVPDLQAAPTQGRQVLAIDEWQPRRLGHATAAEEIAAAIEARFHRAPPDQAWLTPLIGLREEQPGPAWIVKGDQFDLDPTGTEDDADTAADRSTRQFHALIRPKAADLATVVKRLGNQLGREWDGFIQAAEDFLAVIDRETDALPEHLVPLWEASVRLASFLEQDQRLIAQPDAMGEVLPADIHRRLADLVGSAAPFVRRFPTARDLDDERGAYLTNQALFKPAIDLLAIARREELVPASAVAHLTNAVETGERGGEQGSKAAAYVAKGARNLIVRGGSFAAGFMWGAVASGYAEQSPLIPRIGKVLVSAETSIAAFMSGFPADLQQAFKRLTEEAKQPPGHSAFAPLPNPPVLPTQLPIGTVITDGPEMPEMVLIPAGSFLMGVPEEESQREENRFDHNARPVHRVTIARPFFVGKYPVTRGQYAAFVKDTRYAEDDGAWRSPGFRQTQAHPVVNVSHVGAVAFAAWVAVRTGKDYHLPSEAEWEYAARAGTTTARYWGDGFEDSARYAWTGGLTTAPVTGDRLPNAFGLHDMLGNVWEWMADPWHDNYIGAPDNGSIWITDDNAQRVIRGGSWGFPSMLIRSGVRVGDIPRDRNNFIGFRLSRTP